MGKYTQADRPVKVKTPLGDDALLLAGFTGREAISELFQFRVNVLADPKLDVSFDKLLGAPITLTVDLPDGKSRFIDGICQRVSQGEQDDEFATYTLDVVPHFWLLTKRVQSRIFQHVTVPDILKKVLEGLKVNWDGIQGKYEPRDYCVQYRESDFNFASRLMEEEGIYYFFDHDEQGHKLVLADSSKAHPAVPGKSTITFEKLTGGIREDDRIHAWEKMQEIRSGKYTLWDHCFELPHKHLEASQNIQESVAIGTVTHKLKVANNDKLEIYDYPGAYAQRFDGITRGGGEQPAEVQKIFQDNARTVAIRMQQEALSSLMIRASSNSKSFSSGFKFTMEKHPNADGEYVITSVAHDCQCSLEYRSGSGAGVQYQNKFTCIPIALPFKPAQKSLKPTVRGSQTAVVVGPAGEEIFCDKYSRVKVQFHWDQAGKNDADSSCWVRVSTQWAGKQWGIIHIPRIGQEVIVDFLEGDPDQPIIMGSVYNAEQLPPYGLPGSKTQSGIKTRSSLGGSPENFNEICFEDKKGQELLYIRAEKDQTIAVENDESHWVGHDRLKTVDNDETVLVHGNRTETVDKNETITIHQNRMETVDGNEAITIHKNRTETVDIDETISIGGNRTETVSKSETVTIALMRTHTIGINDALTVGAAQEVTVGAIRTLTVGANQTTSIGNNHSVSVGGGQTIAVAKELKESVGGNYEEKVKKSKKVEIGEDMGSKIGKNLSFTAGDQITLTTGESQIIMKKDGTIQIKGKDIILKASGDITGKAGSNMVLKGSSKITLN